MRRGVSSRGRRCEDTRLPSEHRVGDRLLGFAAEWHRVTTDSFVRGVVRDGYRVELVALPPLSPVPIPMLLSRDSEKAPCLRNEITSLLNKGAVEKLDTATLSPAVLQSELLGGQERRHIQASIRLEVPDRLRSQGEVQNDYSQGSDTRVAQGGFGGRCRFEKRILPCPHTQVVTPTTAICSRRF